MHPVGQHGQLTGLGTKQGPFGRDDVADVPFLEFLVDAVGQPVAFQAHLDLPRAVGKLDEARLAHDTLDHHATRNRDINVLGAQRFVVVVVKRLVQFVGNRIAAKVVRVGVALLPQHRQLAAPFGNQLVFVVSIFVRHVITVPV